MTKWNRLVLAAGLAGAFGLTACAAPPATDSSKLKATLSGAAEVPPNSSAATGSMQAQFDRQTRQLSWTISYSGLSAPATAAHFHGPALPGQNAGVVVPFASAESPITGQTTLTAEQVTELLAGKWYINVHTATHPGGEIRGQVMTGP